LQAVQSAEDDIDADAVAGSADDDHSGDDSDQIAAARSMPRSRTSPLAQAISGTSA
jgi:hypothetical protein